MTHELLKSLLPFLNEHNGNYHVKTGYIVRLSTRTVIMFYMRGRNLIAYVEDSECDYEENINDLSSITVYQKVEYK